MVIDPIAEIYQAKLEEALMSSRMRASQGDDAHFQETVDRFREVYVFLNYAIWQRILMPIPAKLSMYL